MIIKGPSLEQKRLIEEALEGLTLRNLQAQRLGVSSHDLAILTRYHEIKKIEKANGYHYRSLPPHYKYRFNGELR